MLKLLRLVVASDSNSPVSKSIPLLNESELMFERLLNCDSAESLLSDEVTSVGLLMSAQVNVIAVAVGASDVLTFAVSVVGLASPKLADTSDPNGVLISCAPVIRPASVDASAGAGATSENVNVGVNETEAPLTFKLTNPNDAFAPRLAAVTDAPTSMLVPAAET